MKELPKGWVWAKLPDVCDVLDYARIPVNSEERAKRVGPYPYYGANGQAGTIDGYLFDGEHILLAEDGGFFDQPGRGVAYLVDGCFWVNNHAHILRVLGGAPPSLLVNQLNRIDWRGYASGTTRLKLTQGAMLEVPVTVPPLNEQRRIVAKLDDLLARSKRAKEELAAIPALLERYRQSVLAAAFRGDLTADWRAKHPEVEPASELLKRIRQERRLRWEESELARLTSKGKTPADKKWKDRYDEAEPHETSSDMPLLPEMWRWVSLAEVADVVTGGTPPGSVSGCYGGSIPFVKPTDLDAGEQVLGARASLSALGATFVEAVPAGTTMVTCIGATIGKSGLAQVVCATNQQINSAVPCALLESTYLYWYLRSAFSQEWIRANASATTLPILNKGRFSRLPIPLPPLEEQRLIAASVAQTNARLRAMPDELTQQSAALDALDRAILIRAFRGELVPQDPSDEPAAVLLERIRAERAAAPPAARRGRRPAAR